MYGHTVCHNYATSIVLQNFGAKMQIIEVWAGMEIQKIY